MKVRPTISGPLAVYLSDLVPLGVYGATPSEVARWFVREGICHAIEKQVIPTRQFDKRGNRVEPT